MQEAAFFGNIFVSPPKAYYCNGSDWDRGPVMGRIGSTSGSPYVNPFGGNATCASRCAGGPDGYTNCAGFTKVITVYRDFDPGRGYKIRNLASGFVMDVLNWSKAPGAPITLYTSNPNGGSNQVFSIERVNSSTPSGHYRLRNKNSGLYMAVKGGSTAANAAITQEALSSGQEQLWNLIQVHAGQYILENVKSRLLLNSNGSRALNAPVVQNGRGFYTDSQMWKLQLI
jgi:hypothetical protein